MQHVAFLFRNNSCRIMDANPGMGEKLGRRGDRFEIIPICRLGEGNKASGSDKKKKTQGESAGAASCDRQQTELHMHLPFSLADGRDAVGRAGQAAAPDVGRGQQRRRGDAEPPPSRQWAPARGKSWKPGAALPPRCSDILVCRQDS